MPSYIYITLLFGVCCSKVIMYNKLPVKNYFHNPSQELIFPMNITCDMPVKCLPETIEFNNHTNTQLKTRRPVDIYFYSKQNQITSIDCNKIYCEMKSIDLYTGMGNKFSNHSKSKLPVGTYLLKQRY